MEDLKKRLKIAIIKNDTTVKRLAESWGIRNTLISRVYSGKTKSKRIMKLIIDYIGGEE